MRSQTRRVRDRPHQTVMVPIAGGSGQSGRWWGCRIWGVMYGRTSCWQGRFWMEWRRVVDLWMGLAYWAQCFQSGKPRCHRLHPFSTDRDRLYFLGSPSDLLRLLRFLFQTARESSQRRPKAWKNECKTRMFVFSGVALRLPQTFEKFIFQPWGSHFRPHGQSDRPLGGQGGLRLCGNS